MLSGGRVDVDHALVYNISRGPMSSTDDPRNAPQTSKVGFRTTIRAPVVNDVVRYVTRPLSPWFLVVSDSGDQIRLRPLCNCLSKCMYYGSGWTWARFGHRSHHEGWEVLDG